MFRSNSVIDRDSVIREMGETKMLLYRRTSLLESSAQTLVNTVNCVGVMGGIAKDFKAREPKMFEAYKKLCEEKRLEPGKLWLWRGMENWTLNFPTKKHWRNPSQIEWIEAGLDKFVSGYEKLEIREISFPRLGCGNGGLDWKDVRPLMEMYLTNLKIEVYIHDYTVDVGLPEHLENVSRQLAAEPNHEPTFDSFLQDLTKIVALAGDTLVQLTPKQPLVAHTTADGLVLESVGREWHFDEEALRGV
jgi:O-acetyl-ADP-ribose deacetylase (regulator of RNase III)